MIKPGSIFESTDSRRDHRVKVLHITGNGYALCARRINGRYRDDAKSVTRIRADRLEKNGHWKLVRAA